MPLNLGLIMEMIVKTSRDNHGMGLDASPYEFNGARSIELFRPQD